MILNNLIFKYQIFKFKIAFSRINNSNYLLRLL